MRKCPACTKELTARDSFGIEIDLCTSCGGCWFDAKEADHFFALKKTPPLLVNTMIYVPTGIEIPEGQRRCPNCIDQTLILSEKKGVKLDLCSSCKGIWFDRNEFATLHKQD